MAERGRCRTHPPAKRKSSGLGRTSSRVVLVPWDGGEGQSRSIFFHQCMKGEGPRWPGTLRRSALAHRSGSRLRILRESRSIPRLSAGGHLGRAGSGGRRPRNGSVNRQGTWSFSSPQRRPWPGGTPCALGRNRDSLALERWRAPARTGLRKGSYWLCANGGSGSSGMSIPEYQIL